MFTVLQEFVQALVGNSMLLMVVVTIPVGAGALVFYILAREPVRPELGGWLGRLTHRGRRAVPRVRPRRGRGAARPAHRPDPVVDGPGVGAVASARATNVTFIEPYQDEDADEVYELDEIDLGVEAEDGFDGFDILPE
jgi:hypothetical protein